MPLSQKISFLVFVFVINTIALILYIYHDKNFFIVNKFKYFSKQIKIKNEVIETYFFEKENKKKEKGSHIAIGCAITSHGRHKLNPDNVAMGSPLLKTLLPSFCRTASNGYNYHFYIAYDVSDPCFNQVESLKSFQKHFKEIVSEMCPITSNVSLLFVRCIHSKNPAWAQNDAMMEAYIDNMDYYYRLNDDTKMLTPGWTEIFIQTLKNFNPPNVGVVGPQHKGGNEGILTYDFVHRSHLEIFGTYYPRVFTDWWADNWISSVYGPLRTLKMPNVRLIHTGEAGTRYNIIAGREFFLEKQTKKDKKILEKFLESFSYSARSGREKRVISMSLWGSNPRFLFGVLRNAQLIKIFFPGWILRIYIEKKDPLGLTRFSPIDMKFVEKYRKMGVEVIEVDYSKCLVPPNMWRFLAADDLTLDAFIVRNADCRLNNRDAKIVENWLETNAPIHCIRDHPNHKNYALLGGLWGGRPKKIKKKLNNKIREMMANLKSGYIEEIKFLSNNLYPIFKSFIICYDSVSCNKWNRSIPIPLNRVGLEHLGQIFDAFGNPKDSDLEELINSQVNLKCLPTSIDHQSIKFTRFQID